MKLKIESKILLGMLCIAPKIDIREYLKGIFIETIGDDAIVVATDGRVLGAYYCRDVCARDDDDADTSFIIPRVLLESAKLRNKGVCEITIGKKGATDLPRDISLTENLGGTIFGKEVDGAFPSWRRPIPKSVSGETAQFDPALIQKFAEASYRINGTKRDAMNHVFIGHNGEAGALITIGREEFVGVLMPLRMAHVADSIPTAPPAWAM